MTKRETFYSLLPLVTLLMTIVVLIMIFYSYSANTQRIHDLEIQNEMLLKVLDNQTIIITESCNQGVDNQLK